MLNSSGAAAYKDQSKEYQAYLSYLVNDMLTSNNKVLLSGKIDSSDKTYKAWHDSETINIKKYLNYAISKNWIDTSKLTNYMPKSGKYSDSTELYKALVSYIMDELKSNSSFDKMIYKYMIKAGTITGRQICLMLYEQNVLKKSDAQYAQLKAGSLGSYDFIRAKIKKLEITPGELGLEPSTGSVSYTHLTLPTNSLV